MFSFFSRNAASGLLFPFVAGLTDSLEEIDFASPGYAKQMIERIAEVKGIGEAQYESLLQICAEIYVTIGGVGSADKDANDKPLFTHEPRVRNGKNPEFEACANGIWYAIEAKAPKLIQHSRVRASRDFQLTARWPEGTFVADRVILPRDNPVKDFLISANEKFEAYSTIRANAYRVLTIVWDDHIAEAITALLHPTAGLLTPNSFARDQAGNTMTFPFVDGILLCRYQSNLLRMTRTEPDILPDDELGSFIYFNHGFPPKCLIQNPSGTPIPEALFAPLNATLIQDCLGAEYHATDLVMWCQRQD